MYQRRSWRSIPTAVAGLAALTALSGCGQSNDKASASGISASSGAEPVTNRPLPVNNPQNRKPRIAVLTFSPSSTEFFKAPFAGAQRAVEVLRSRGATVDVVPLTDFSVAGVNSAMRTVITQKYDGLVVPLLGAANCTPVQEATAAGIKVGVMLTTADCAQGAGALFFHGEDSADRWKDTVAAKMVEVTKGEQPCKVAVITGDFNVLTQEQRRIGFLAGLEGSQLTAVDKGVAGGLDPAKLQAAARDYASANRDLCGILVTVGDNGASASGLTTEQASRIKMISADLTTGSVQQIKVGKLYGTFTQDPFGEGYDSTIWVYNAVLSGQGPAGGFEQPVKGTFVTKDNVDAAFKAQNDGH